MPTCVIAHLPHVQITDFGLTRDLAFDPYYLSAGKKIPIRWTAPEVG